MQYHNKNWIVFYRYFVELYNIENKVLKNILLFTFIILVALLLVRLFNIRVFLENITHCIPTNKCYVQWKYEKYNIF